MKKKCRNVPLTWREGQGYSKDCGAVLKEDGVRRYKRWYFGTDKTDAERLAGIALAEWRIIRLNGGNVWTPDALARIEFARLGLPGKLNRSSLITAKPPLSDGAATPEANPPSSMVSRRSVHHAMIAYEANLDQRAASGQVSDSHRISQQACLRRVRKMMPDMALSGLDYAQLLLFANTIAARPPTSRGDRMSVSSVWNTVTALKLFLTYLEDSGQWRPQFNWRRSLRLKRACLMTEDERETVKKTPTYSADELRKLWNRATEHTRLYLLLALNTGATQTEIATLRLSHLHLDGTQPFIERSRNKTQVAGRWPLWKETVELLSKFHAPEKGRRNPKGLALVNEDGDPLLRYTKAGRNDAITKSWQRLTYQSQRQPPQYKIVGCVQPIRARVQPATAVKSNVLSFKYLRKTTYCWIKERFGTDVAEWFAQHKERNMVTAYSDPVFEKVARAVMQFRSDFLPQVFKESPNPLRPSARDLMARLQKAPT